MLPGALCDSCGALSGPGRFPVGEGDEVAVGCARGTEFAGPLLELLAQVAGELFEFGDPGLELAGFAGVPEAAVVKDLRAADFGQAGGEAVVLPPQPLVVFVEVGQAGEQGLPGRGGGCRAGGGSGGPCVDLRAQVVVAVEE